MKSILTIVLFLSAVLSITQLNSQPRQPSSFKLNSFKDVPEDLQGCGDSYYLSESEKKAGRSICFTDYDVYFLKINGKSYRLTEKEASGKYSIDVKELTNKKEDVEYHVLTAILTIKLGSKVIWQKKVIGDGGC